MQTVDYKYFIERTDTNEWFNEIEGLSGGRRKGPSWTNNAEFAHSWDKKEYAENYLNNSQFFFKGIDCIITEHEFVPTGEQA